MKQWAGVFLILSFCFAALLAADLMGKFRRVPNPIAYLKVADGTVRRLGANQLTWDRAQKGTLFAAYDTISTGASAQAKLVFYSGGELDLSPGTMVVLNGDIEELQLNFLTGNALLRVAKRSRKRIQVSKVAVRDQVTVKEVDRLSVPSAPTEEEKTKGRVDLDPALARKIPAETQKTIVRKAITEKSIRNPAAVLTTQGEAVSALKLPPIPELIFPEEAAIFRAKPGLRPTLTWKLPEPDTQSAGIILLQPRSYEVVLRPRNGKRPRVIRTQRTRLSVSGLAEGDYTWSVRSLTDRGKPSPMAEARSFRVVKAPSKPKPEISRPKVLPVKVE